MFYRIGFSVSFFAIILMGLRALAMNSGDVTTNQIHHLVYAVGALVFFGVNWIVEELEKLKAGS